MSDPDIGHLSEPTALRLDGAASRARLLLGSRGGGESSDAAAIESSRTRVGPPGNADVQAIRRQLMHARKSDTPRAAIAGRDEAAEVTAIATALVERARTVMTALESGASTGSIDLADAVALESVIRTRGRPALRILGDEVESLSSDKHPGSGFWRPLLNDHEAQLAQVANVTGAVMARDKLTGAPPWVQGTAWLIKPDLAITNRHVVFPPSPGVRLAKRQPAKATEARIKDDFELVLDFAFDDGPARNIQRLVTGIPYVAEERDPVDVAILQLAPAASVASPLELALAPNVARQLYVIGHPGPIPDVPDKVLAVFGTPNGRKRVCFGELMPADTVGPGEFGHDASTIGGFSGSCVLAFTSSSVVALHYYGDPLRGNRAITAATLRSHLIAAYL